MRLSLVGHAVTLARVPDPLPPTLLLTGPEGVGKRVAAADLAQRTGVRDLDFQNLGPLTRDAARRLIEHHAVAPLTGSVKVTVADLTGVGPHAANAILKVLESPPSYSHIILHSDTEPLLTIRSRCFNLRFGILTVAEVAQVLDRLGVSDPQEAARCAHGRVSLGLDYARSKGTRRAAEAVLVAVAQQDGSRAEYALAKALEAGKNASRAEVEARRTVLCRLLAQSLRASLSAPEHALARVPLDLRLRALEILDGHSRPALRARSATWVMLVGP